MSQSDEDLRDLGDTVACGMRIVSPTDCDNRCLAILFSLFVQIHQKPPPKHTSASELTLCLIVMFLELFLSPDASFIRALDFSLTPSLLLRPPETRKYRNVETLNRIDVIISKLKMSSGVYINVFIL